MTVPNKSPLPPGEGQGEGHNLLTTHLPLLAGAPNGIKKLRELILELAVRGKLVPQDPSDEPASELLKRIAEERALSGNLKKAKLLAEIAEDEQPFAAPSSWVISRLGYVGEWAVGSGFPTQEQGLTDQSIPFCKVSDMNLSGNERFILTANNSIDEATASRLRVNVHPAGTVVFPKIGGAIATNKRRLLVKPTAIDNNCLGLTPNGTLSSDYLYLLLSSIDLTKYQAGTSVPALSQGVLADIVVGIPPLAEQGRIVAKVDQLMALCDQLEAQQADADSAHTQLVQALLDSLTQARDAGDFTQSWQRLAEHFHTLFTTESSIDALKQTLLQLAVMGKLVPQEPSDEPASELLKRIAEEKARLVAEGNIRKQKPLTEIADEEKPFQLPAGWEWVRLDSLLRKIGAGSTPLGGKQGYVSEGIKFLRSQNVWNEGLRLDDVALIPESTHQKMSGTHVAAGDLLFNITGASIGRCAIVPDDFDTGNVSQHVTIVRPVMGELRQFLHVILTSQLVQQTVMDVQVGVSREGLSIGKLSQFAIPCPPEAEQHRIVAKVDQLMALCDQLKARLNQARQVHEQLANALVEQVVA